MVFLLYYVFWLDSLGFFLESGTMDTSKWSDQNQISVPSRTTFLFPTGRSPVPFPIISALITLFRSHILIYYELIIESMGIYIRGKGKSRNKNWWENHQISFFSFFSRLNCHLFMGILFSIKFYHSPSSFMFATWFKSGQFIFMHWIVYIRSSITNRKNE